MALSMQSEAAGTAYTASVPATMLVSDAGHMQKHMQKRTAFRECCLRRRTRL